jgi:hypothetical protein
MVGYACAETKAANSDTLLDKTMCDDGDINSNISKNV